jgi:hypothetical protein
MIGAGSRVWPIAAAWVDGIAVGLEKNSPRMHDMISRRVLAILQGLARSQAGVHGGSLYCAVQTGSSLTDMLLRQGLTHRREYWHAR